MNTYNHLIQSIEPTLTAMPFLIIIVMIIGLSLNPHLKNKPKRIIRILAINSFIAFMLYVIITMVFFENELSLAAKIMLDIFTGCFAFMLFTLLIDVIRGTNHFMSIIYAILKYCNMNDITDDEKDKSKEQENEDENPIEYESKYLNKYIGEKDER